jgi:hypothetical protein
MVLSSPAGECRTFQGKVIGFRAPSGKNNSSSCAVDQLCDTTARALNQETPGLPFLIYA